MGYIAKLDDIVMPVVSKLVMLMKEIPFPVAYTTYVISGLSICNAFALLRGRMYISPIPLIALRTFFFSLLWWPVQRVSPMGGTLLLAYLPIFADLSEHHYGTSLSGFLKLRWAGKWLRQLLDIKLVRTVPIEDKQCIIGIHPHAILPLGGVINLGFDADEFNELFPTLRNRKILAASSCFLVPGFRELLISNDVHDCTRQNAKGWLKKRNIAGLGDDSDSDSGSGTTICLVPGGAREGLYANPDVDWLDLRRKVGFLRLAVEHNVKVLPTFTFNEVDYVEQVGYNVLPWLPQAMRVWLWQKTFGISLPLITSVFSGGFTGLHLTTVVGEPIQLPYHNDAPTAVQLEECMDIYIGALQRLYDEHAPKYNSRPRKLVIS
jgi:2-acylglycerol O-acyltransferase 2